MRRVVDLGTGSFESKSTNLDDGSLKYYGSDEHRLNCGGAIRHRPGMLHFDLHSPLDQVIGNEFPHLDRKLEELSGILNAEIGYHFIAAAILSGQFGRARPALRLCTRRGWVSSNAHAATLNRRHNGRAGDAPA